MNFNEDIYTAYTVSTSNAKITPIKTDESKLPQPGEILKINDMVVQLRR